jgi:hypothetical protein
MAFALARSFNGFVLSAFIPPHCKADGRSWLVDLHARVNLARDAVGQYSDRLASMSSRLSRTVWPCLYIGLPDAHAAEAASLHTRWAELSASPRLKALTLAVACTS